MAKLKHVQVLSFNNKRSYAVLDFSFSILRTFRFLSAILFKPQSRSRKPHRKWDVKNKLLSQLTAFMLHFCRQLSTNRQTGPCLFYFAMILFT